MRGLAGAILDAIALRRLLMFSGGGQMLPTRAFLQLVANAIAADALGFAELTPFVRICLAKNPFTPGPDLVLDDLTAADFDGYAVKHAGDASPSVFTDPNTGEWIIQLDSPAGGWHWQANGVTNFPQTIYGWYCTAADGDTLHAAELFSSPITLTAIGDGIDIAEARVRLSNTALT